MSALTQSIEAHSSRITRTFIAQASERSNFSTFLWVCKPQRVWKTSCTTKLLVSLLRVECTYSLIDAMIGIQVEMNIMTLILFIKGGKNPRVGGNCGEE